MTALDRAWKRHGSPAHRFDELQELAILIHSVDLVPGLLFGPCLRSSPISRAERDGSTRCFSLTIHAQHRRTRQACQLPSQPWRLSTLPGSWQSARLLSSQVTLRSTPPLDAPPSNALRCEAKFTAYFGVFIGLTAVAVRAGSWSWGTPRLTSPSPTSSGRCGRRLRTSNGPVSVGRKESGDLSNANARPSFASTSSLAFTLACARCGLVDDRPFAVVWYALSASVWASNAIAESSLSLFE